MSKKLNFAKKNLQKEYKIKSTVDIAKEFKCSSTTIQKYLKIYKIPIRNSFESQLDKHIGKKNEMFGKKGKLVGNYIDGRSLNKKKYSKQYYQENKDEILEQQKKYFKQRRKNDINFRILCNLRKRLWEAVKYTKKSQLTTN